ncbi:hypothetical protein DNTS_025348, partial [Danionella cerebrum]
MCPEITTMKGNYQKDTVKAPGCTQKWPKSKKRTFPRTNIGEKRRRILPWTSRKPQTNPERIDEPIDGGVFSSSDSDFDRSMDFQQRDFENIFFRSEIIAQTPTQGGGTLRHSCVMTCTPRLQNGLQSRGQQVADPLHGSKGHTQSHMAAWSSLLASCGNMCKEHSENVKAT